MCLIELGQQRIIIQVCTYLQLTSGGGSEELASDGHLDIYFLKLSTIHSGFSRPGKHKTS